MDGDEIVIVGSIGGPYGVKGWVRVNSFTEPPGNLADYGPWLLQNEARWREAHPQSVRAHGSGLVALFPGVDDRNGAAALTGTQLGVRRAMLPDPEEEEYYWRDLEGLEVVDQRGRRLGWISYLMDTGAHPVVVVEGEHGECLIPFVERHVVGVDLANGRLNVDWEEPE